MKTTCAACIASSGVYHWSCLECRIRHAKMVPPYFVGKEVDGIVKDFGIGREQLLALLERKESD